MPTLLALVSASISGFLAFKLLREYSPLLGGMVCFVLWGGVYFYVKKLMRDLRP